MFEISIDAGTLRFKTINTDQGIKAHRLLGLIPYTLHPSPLSNKHHIEILPGGCVKIIPNQRVSIRIVNQGIR